MRNNQINPKNIDSDIFFAHCNMYNAITGSYNSSILRMRGIREILSDMINFFSSPEREEYEKCQKIKEIMKKIPR